jgi:shikimate kinase
MTVFLCGFMGCGKTTIGQVLAQKLGVHYIDMDEYIVKKEGKKIPEIFSEKGEEYFRMKETEAVRELAEREAVIACGGGAVINEKNAEIARSGGVVIFLDVPFEVCYERISGDTNRPLIANNTKQQVEEIYNSRYQIYKKHSSVLIDANNSPSMVADEIKQFVHIFSGR